MTNKNRKIYKLCLSMFIMIKQIQRYGNNLVIVFTKTEEEIYGLKLGDKIVLDDMLIQSKKKEVRENERNK